MKKLIIEIFLFLIGGCFIFPLVFIVGFLYTFFKHIYKLDYSISKHLTPIIRSLTLLLDGMSNAGAGEMLNDVFKITGKIRYGKWFMTISECTGLLYLYVKDIKLRRVLDKVLGKNHCIEAVREEYKFYYKNQKNEKL